jgi:hypothetical protein
LYRYTTACPMPGKEKNKGHDHLSVYVATVGLYRLNHS